MRGRLGQVLPHLAPLQLAELAHAAVVVEHVQRHVFRHAAGEVGIDEAHHGHVGQVGVGEQSIHAGADGDDQAQVRQRLEQPVRRLPGERILDLLGLAEIGRDAHIERRV